MLIWENIRLAFRALLVTKMRAFLTMLGIIIGIGSVIAIMTVSSSLTGSISDSFQQMGANNITVGIKQSEKEEETRSSGMRFGAADRNSTVEEEDLISNEMLEELKEAYPDEIEAVAISETIGNGVANRNGNTANLSISAINPSYYTSSKKTLLAGRYIKQKDLDGNKKVIMVSDKLIESLFDGDKQEALWQKLSLTIDGSNSDYYIIGVYKYESGGVISDSNDEDLTTDAFIPLTTGKEEIHGNEGYSQFTVVTASKVSSISEFAGEIENFFAPYYAANEDYEISTSTMESMAESMSNTIENVTLAISLIAGISLLVGGIGVMNIMLVSITERTREIGTRKALGATNGSIRLQFITESIILCLVGGCLGVITGLVLGTVAASILGYSATAPVGAIVAAVAFSMVVGVFFGYYPANKAAKLNPIEALRYE